MVNVKEFDTVESIARKRTGVSINWFAVLDLLFNLCMFVFFILDYGEFQLYLQHLKIFLGSLSFNEWRCLNLKGHQTKYTVLI